MPSVQAIREFCSTLRFRIVLWITLVVFVMVFGMNTALRAIEQRTLRSEYDEFLMDRMDGTSAIIANSPPENQAQLYAALKEKVKTYEYRSLFLQLFDERRQLQWSSANAPTWLDPPLDTVDVSGPYDGKRHRIFEKKLRKDSGEFFFLRCGFLKLTLQEDIDLMSRNLHLASLFLLVLAPIGGYVIADRATRPIAQIIATTAHLQPSNMNERLPIRGTGDELDQLSQTINGMLDRLASYLNQNRDFVANAAHELRSPLAAIRSSVEVGLNHSRTPEEYAVILSDVMEEISRLAGLVNRLLILAEGDAGRLGSMDQHTDLDKIVRESVEMFDAVAELGGVRLSIRELASAMVPGDETYLRQVVRNLIDNAIKYNKNPGTVDLRLHIDSSRKTVLLTIEDSGVGIDPAVLPRIFERFYRADKSRTRENERAGYGLGLSICRTVIQALHGDITVTSEVGRGSTFTVRLPLSAYQPPVAQMGERYVTSPSGS